MKGLGHGNMDAYRVIYRKESKRDINTITFSL